VRAGFGEHEQTLFGCECPLLEQVVFRAGAPHAGYNRLSSGEGIEYYSISQNGGKTNFPLLRRDIPMTRSTRKHPDFVSPSQKAKTAVVQQIARLARRAHLDYDGFLYVCQQARRKLGLRKPRRERRLPQLLTEAELKRFFDVIQNCGDVQHEIMLKLLF